MAKGILGRKLGMTQIFNENGTLVPVTVVDVTPNIVLQQKTSETDGYVATQLGFEDKKEKHATKPEIGHAKKADTNPKRFIKEIRFKEGLENEMVNFGVGQEVKADIFAVGDIIDVTGTSKGHGYEGCITRHNQSRGPMAHGSRYHRSPGSMGPIKGNMKGKKLPGHMGCDTVTIQNLEIASVDTTRDIILVKGNVPGPKQGFIIIKSAVKNSK